MDIVVLQIVTAGELCCRCGYSYVAVTIVLKKVQTKIATNDIRCYKRSVFPQASMQCSCVYCCSWTELWPLELWMVPTWKWWKRWARRTSSSSAWQWMKWRSCSVKGWFLSSSLISDLFCSCCDYHLVNIWSHIDFGFHGNSSWNVYQETFCCFSKPHCPVIC